MDSEMRSNGASSQREGPMLVHAKPLLDDVLRAEAEIANRDYARFANDLGISRRMFRKYRAPSQLWDWRQLAAVLLGDVTDTDLLDYGCGMGEESVYLAKLGARVTAIDISDVGVSVLKRRAQLHGLDIRALEMRCDLTSFAPDSFDRVHGMGILHHVGIEVALAEVWRVLRPGGIGVFLEPVGDPPLVEVAKTFVRKHTRFLGDIDAERDHRPTWHEIGLATQQFSRAMTYPYHVLFRLRRLFPCDAYDAIRRLDHALLALAPRLRRVAGAVVIQVVK